MGVCVCVSLPSCLSMSVCLSVVWYSCACPCSAAAFLKAFFCAVQAGPCAELARVRLRVPCYPPGTLIVVGRARTDFVQPIWYSNAIGILIGVQRRLLAANLPASARWLDYVSGSGPPRGHSMHDRIRNEHGVWVCTSSSSGHHVGGNTVAPPLAGLESHAISRSLSARTSFLRMLCVCQHTVQLSSCMYV